MKQRTQAIILITVFSFPISLPILFIFLFILSLDHSSKEELIENYEAKHKEINEVKRYINSVVSSNKAVEIEFDNTKSIPIFHVFSNGNWDNNWNVEMDSKKTDSLLWKAGWTRKTLLTLKEKLKAADCMSAQSGEPCLIGYHRSSMGKYSYLIFNKNLNDSQKEIFDDKCTHIFYKDNVVLEYVGGAFGMQCFEGDN